MNMISGYLLLPILLTIDFSEQINSITDPPTLRVCKGNSADLIWDLDEEENKISKLEWYFNNKKICTSSDTRNFTVNPLYQGRIEMLGMKQIRLKNISLDDEGIYILFPLLKWSTSQKIQNISLQVLEPPTNKCTSENIYLGLPSNLKCELTASYCGRPQMSAIWKRKHTFEVLGEGNYISINSSFQDNEILCCPEGTAMKCVDDPKQFCKSVSISRADDDKTSKGGNNTLQSDPLTTQAPYNSTTESTNLYCMILCVSIVCSLQTAMFLLLVFQICKISKGNNDLVQKIQMMFMTLTQKDTDPLLADGQSVQGTHGQYTLQIM